MASYIELLKDPRWQRKRLEILQRDEWACKSCGDASSTLHVHHRRYRRGRKPWEYEDGDLVTLCETCHEATTNTKRLLADAIDKLDPGWDGILLGYAEALVSIATMAQRIRIIDGNHASGVLALALDVSPVGGSLISKEDVLALAASSGGSVSIKEIIAFITARDDERMKKA